jgi:hypothetical protein
MTASPGERRPLGRPAWALIAVAAVLSALGGYYLWLARQQPAVAEAPASPPPALLAASDPAPPAAPVEAAAGTTDLRELLEGLSPSDEFRSWIAEGHLVRRWVVVTDNVAEGTTPRKQLPFLAPARPFSVVERGGRTVIAPASYARYDALADLVGSLDAQAVAGIYRRVHGALETAYRALGYPDASFDRATARALARIVAAPVRDRDVEVVDEGGIFSFADPRLEALGEVEKHLLRMGPRNTRILQGKARDLRDALGLPADLAARR